MSSGEGLHDGVEVMQQMEIVGITGAWHAYAM